MLWAVVPHGAAGTSVGGEILVYAIAAAAGALLVAIGRAAMNLVKKRQTERRETTEDQQNLAEFLFGIPHDARTGTPAREGWTSRVDRILGQLSTGQAQTMQLLREVVDRKSVV